jgi:plastocyanin
MLPRGPLAALALAAVLAGCGGDGPAAQPKAGRLDVVLDDFLIDPQEVRAKPGPLVFRATNEGRLGHTLVIRRGERDLARVKTLLPGAKGEATADLRKGKYDLVCILGNHEELGMYGTLVVR